MPARPGRHHGSDRRVEAAAARAEGRRRHLGGKTQMAEDAPNHVRILDERDERQPIAAPRARQDVEAEAPLHQLDPQPVRA